MYGGHPYHSGGPSDWGQPPPPPQQSYPQLPNPKFFLLQNQTNAPCTYFPHPSFPIPPHHPPQNQNPSFPIQNPNLPLQNPNLTLQVQHLLNLLFRPQTTLSQNPNPNADPQQHPSNSASWRPQSWSENPKETVERIDRAVEKIRSELVAAGQSVSAWKVLESTLSMLRVDVWSSLGLQMDQVPSLHRLMLTEGRVNAYIHCFVGVQRITSVYDLELAICKNENVERFEELGLGPFLRHPLVLRYFPVSSDATEAFKITSEEIILLLIVFQRRKGEVKDDAVEEFLDFIAKRRSVASKEKLGIRISSLGGHVSSIRESRMLERSTLRKPRMVVRTFRTRRKPLFFSLKTRGKHFRAISQQAELFSSVDKSFCVKQDGFVSSRSKDGGSKDYSHEKDDKNNDHVTGSRVNFSSQSAKISQRLSRSTLISPAWGSQKHNEVNGSIKKKRKREILSSPISGSVKLRKTDQVEHDVLSTKNGCGTEVSDMRKHDLSIDNNLLRMFITTWKEACQEQTVAEVFWSMVRSCDQQRSTKRIMSLFSSHPFIGLLNVAVSSIKYGMWDSMHDKFHSIDQQGLANTCSECLSTDVEPNIKDAPPVSTEHITEHTPTSHCTDQGRPVYQCRRRALFKPSRTMQKILQKSRKNNTWTSRKSRPESKVCFLCHQVGHVRKNCSQLQQARSSLAPQDLQKSAQYPVRSYTSAQLHPVQAQPQQTSSAPVPQNSGCGFIACGPAGRGQVLTVTEGEEMEEKANAVIDVYMQDVSDKFAASEGSMGASVGADDQKDERTEACLKISGAEASEARIGSGYTKDSTEILRNLCPGLHDCFVGGCGVHETPTLRSYLQILLDLSHVALPSEAANAVFRVFLKWADGLKSGLSAEDIVYLKGSLTTIECTVLPTWHDKWVSLHPSFGLVCWCDDMKLGKQFMHLDGVVFLYFGELSNDDVEMLFKKASRLMKALGIPALSEAVTREAIFYGLADCSFKAALLDWALPYAQRYLHCVHPDKYSQLRDSGFDILNRLQVVVVEILFYQDVIKSSQIKSKKLQKCSCLLQGSILYTTQEPDSHALFVELSRLFFDGNPELHLANFLHMITTMAESGSTEEQTEYFILNSQKVPKLSGAEFVWSLSSVSSLTDNYESLAKSFTSKVVNEQNSLKSKRKAIKWPPVTWKTAPSFGYVDANISKTETPAAQLSSALQNRIHDDSECIVRQIEKLTPISVDINWTTEDDSATTSAALVLPDCNVLQEHAGDACNETDCGMHIEFDPINDFVSDPVELGPSNFSRRDQSRYGMSSGRDAMLTGRLGELVAFKYLIAKAGKSVVKWVNECKETGLPYDIVIGEKENSREFIEVKATQSPRKDWFRISMREWQFAVDKGEAFSILHVILLGNNAARVSMHKNPAKLCQLGKLQLLLTMPKQHKELFFLS